MIRRYGIAVGVATAVTFLLLFIMQLLIATERGPALAERKPHMLDFVRVAPTETVETKERKPERPPEPEHRPEQPRPANADNRAGGIAVSMTVPALETGTNLGGIGFGISDGDHQPLVKPTPLYPTRAAIRDLEGYAVVEYTVTRAGTTTDIRVVESSDRVFEKSCVDAAEQFKYRPRMIDGEAVEVRGVRNRCTFRLEQ